MGFCLTLVWQLLDLPDLFLHPCEKDLQILRKCKLPLSGTIANIRTYVHTKLTGKYIGYKVAIRLTLQLPLARLFYNFATNT